MRAGLASDEFEKQVTRARRSFFSLAACDVQARQTLTNA